MDDDLQMSFERRQYLSLLSYSITSLHTLIWENSLFLWIFEYASLCAFLSNESCLQCHNILQIFIMARAEAHAQEQLAPDHFTPMGF